MVLSSFGIDLPEVRLRSLTDCTPFGTDAFRVVEAARELGFGGSRKHTLSSVDDLADLIDDGLFPVVYVDLWPLRGGLSGQYHALVAVAIGPNQVIVLDPQSGERAMPREDFDAAWAQMRYLTILITL
jgi:ABC-type bacteriocin/lantibiotic exporter with double-glycine peptidase domain